MQQDPVVSDFVTKMLLGSPVTRPRAGDLLNHPYVLNPPEVRTGVCASARTRSKMLFYYYFDEVTWR